MNPKENTTKKRAVIYCRVSSDRQVENYSLGTQDKICTEYAERNGYEIIEKFTEEGESAKTANRTKLKELLKYCYEKSNSIQAVIFYKIDRFARDRVDYDSVCCGLRAKGLVIRSATEPIAENPTGRLMEGVLASFAQFDNEIRTERCVIGMKAALKAGRFIWMAPIGYSNSLIDGKGNIVLNDKASLVKAAFEEVLKNKEPIDVIYRTMTKSGLTGKSGKPLARSHFYEMLRNKTYAGILNGFGETHEGLFEPLISKKLFNQVQLVLKYRGRKNYTAYQIQNPDFPLRRFFIHPDGSKLTGAWSKGRSKKYAYYRYIPLNIQVSKEKLEAGFADFLNCFQFDEKVLDQFKASLKKQFLKSTSSERLSHESLKKMIIAEELKLDLVFQEKQRGGISEFIFQRQIQNIEKRLADCHSQLTEKSDQKYDFNEMISFVEEYLKNPGKIWMDASFNKKLKLQWFQFPQGVIFDGNEFRTTEIRSIYKVKGVFLPTKSGVVDHLDKTTNNIEMTSGEKSIADKEFLGKVLEDLTELASILRN